MKLKIKKYFFIFLLSELLLSYAPAYAQPADVYDYSQKAGVSAQIEKYLCAPSRVAQSQTKVLTTGGTYTDRTAQQQYAAANNSNSGDLYNCINRLYTFAIILASVIGVFFIVIAGYVYIGSDGNSESVEKAKSILAGGINSVPGSPHFEDQALMYTECKFKDVLFYKEDVMKKAERTYHPGE